jgi:hypothetical protein
LAWRTHGGNNRARQSAITAIPLPLSFGPLQLSAAGIDVLQAWLWEEYRIEVPIVPWASPLQKFARISAQLYNHLDHYRYLVTALQTKSEAWTRLVSSIPTGS